MVASRWLGGRKAKAQGRGMGPSLARAISAMFCSEFAYVFRLSVSMRKVAGEHQFCVLINVNSYIFHICFLFLFILLSYLIFDFVCLTLSLADTRGIAKYARTYIRDINAHAHAHQKKVERSKTKKREVRNERKKKMRKDK